MHKDMIKSHPKISVRNSSAMSIEERNDEIACILIRGIKRLHAKTKSYKMGINEYSIEVGKAPESEMSLDDYRQSLDKKMEKRGWRVNQ